MTTKQIAHEWKAGRTAKAGALHTNGRELHSYALRIGYTTDAGEKVIIDYRGEGHISATTSRHVRMAHAVADLLVAPSALKGTR